MALLHICTSYRGTNSRCSGLSFQEYLYGEQPWKVALEGAQRAGLYTVLYNK